MLTIFKKISILDVWLSSECAHEVHGHKLYNKKVIFRKMWSSLTEKLVILWQRCTLKNIILLREPETWFQCYCVNCLALFCIVYNFLFPFAFANCFEISSSWRYFSLSTVLIQFSQLFRLSRMTCVYCIMYSKSSW